MQLLRNDEIIIDRLRVQDAGISDYSNISHWQTALDGQLSNAFSKRVVVINKLRIGFNAKTTRHHPSTYTSQLASQLAQKTEVLAQQAVHVSDRSDDSDERGKSANQSTAIYFNDHVEWVVSFIIDKYKDEEAWYWKSIAENKLSKERAICQTLCNNTDNLDSILAQLAEKKLAVPILMSLSDSAIQEIWLGIQSKSLWFFDLKKLDGNDINNNDLSLSVNYIYDANSKLINAIVPYHNLLKSCFSKAQINKSSARYQCFLEIFSTLLAWQYAPSQLQQKQSSERWFYHLKKLLSSANSNRAIQQDLAGNLGTQVDLLPLISSKNLTIIDNVVESALDKQAHLAAFNKQAALSPLAHLNVLKPNDDAQKEYFESSVLSQQIQQKYESQLLEQMREIALTKQSDLKELFDQKVNVTDIDIASKEAFALVKRDALKKRAASATNTHQKVANKPLNHQNAQAISQIEVPDSQTFSNDDSEFYTTQGGVFYLLQCLSNPRCQALIDQEQINPWQCIYYLCRYFNIRLDATLLKFFADQLYLNDARDLHSMPELSIKSQYLLPIYLHEQFSLSKNEFKALFKKRARVTLYQRHLDVHFHLKAIDIKVRLAGLDINPGWLPLVALVVNFHYKDEAQLLDSIALNSKNQTQMANFEGDSIQGAADDF